MQIVDKDSAACAQILYHKFVVYNLMAHIDGSAKYLQRTVDDINGTINPGTKAAGICQPNLHRQNLSPDWQIARSCLNTTAEPMLPCRR